MKGPDRADRADRAEPSGITINQFAPLCAGRERPAKGSGSTMGYLPGYLVENVVCVRLPARACNLSLCFRTFVAEFVLTGTRRLAGRRGAAAISCARATHLCWPDLKVERAFNARRQLNSERSCCSASQGRGVKWPDAYPVRLRARTGAVDHWPRADKNTDARPAGWPARRSHGAHPNAPK